MKSKKKKVFIGMSGGVDSSVSAVLLKQAGYDVTGVFIKVWQPPEGLIGPGSCTWKEDRRDAMRVAALLDIPFFTLNLEKEYKREVIDYMIREYKAGRTPNPDVMCNQEIKFGAFLAWARKHGADYIATGHYAKVNESKGLQLSEGKDKNKDQSYFLWTLKQKELKSVLFPVGGLEKGRVRTLARKFKLPNAEKKDSQGLCFVGKIEIKDFLIHFIKEKRGKVLNEEGGVIGNHRGVLFFTIGERHGFEITKKSPNDSPYYVIGKNVKKNELIVSNKKNIKAKKLGVNEVTISSINWISGKAPISRNLQARIRYRQEKQKIRIISQHNKSVRIVFEKSQEGLSAGQSLVIYAGEECLGGGIISYN